MLPYKRDIYAARQKREAMREDQSSTRLYVGNLPHHVTEEMLGDYFAQVGLVQSVKIAHDRVTGRRKGFAFVKMASEEEVELAISEFDGKEWEGRELRVNAARPPRRLDTQEYFERHFCYHRFHHD